MKLKQTGTINRIAITFIFLLILWLLFTFSLNPFSLLLGVIFSFVISLVSYDLFVEKEERIQQGYFPKFQYFFAYIFVLIREIYLGSLSVIYSVITMKINPKVVKIKTDLGSKFARAVLANSITLTPGTVTIDLHDDELLVHCLSSKPDKKIKGNFETQLRRIFY